MNQDVLVVFNDGSRVQFDGAEAMLDATEGVLILFGDDGAKITFNWNVIQYYFELPYETEEDE